MDGTGILLLPVSIQFWGVVHITRESVESKGCGRSVRADDDCTRLSARVFGFGRNVPRQVEIENIPLALFLGESAIVKISHDLLHAPRGTLYDTASTTGNCLCTRRGSRELPRAQTDSSGLSLTNGRKAPSRD